MARLFDDGSSEYLKITQAILSAVPLAVACHFNSDNIADQQTLMCFSNSGGLSVFQFVAAGAVGGDPIILVVGDEVGSFYAETSTGYSANTWHHACGICAANNDKRVFLDGGSKGTDANAKTPAGIDVTSIGARVRAATSNHMSGMIAEAAIWDLSDWPGATGADKANNFEKIVPSLAKGFSPLFYPLGLVSYYSLVRDTDDDIVSGYDMTPFNTPSVGNHPAVIYPTNPLLNFGPYIAPVGAPGAMTLNTGYWGPTI